MKEMSFVVSHIKGLNTLHYPREGELQGNSVSLKSTLRYCILILFSEKPGLKDEQIS